jgi:hypothetical protein
MPQLPAESQALTHLGLLPFWLLNGQVIVVLVPDTDFSLPAVSRNR